eukprot:2405383-Pleurochrysis_carterae.AAC.1
MRARDTAARHALADARCTSNSDAEINAMRNDVLTTAHRELNSAREALTAMHGELDAAREQLSSMLAESPNAANPRSGMDARLSARTQPLDTPTTVTQPRPCSPTPARPDDAPPTVNQSRPYSACSMLSILLNVAALGAI